MHKRNASSRSRAGLVAVGLLAVLAWAPAPARAEGDSMAREGGLGATAALVTLIYGPVKIFYAGGGLFVGALAWAFSGGDYEVASPILNAAVRGDYVVTPDHLGGCRPLDFIGRAPEDRRMRAGGGGY